ncbi:MAG: hypothetical protein CL908_19950 [Deltaproteobacteria bacterium]|nr:hypothetical protein [Deltaproteobacteria bacterium]
MPPPSSATPSGHRHLYAGISLVAMSVLMLEVALTRVFAIQLWHHFAYMVVSLALLGFGASGSLLTALRIGERKGSVTRLLAGFGTAYGIALALVLLLVTRIDIDSLAIWKEPSNAWLLLLTFILLSIPFLLAGCAIGTTLTRNPKIVGRLYGADLAGSAVGGALAPGLLGTIGSVPTVMVAVALGLLGGAAYACGLSTRRAPFLAPAVIGVVVAVLFATGTLSWTLHFAPNKAAHAAFSDGRHDRTLTSSTAQVDVGTSAVGTAVIGGEFGQQDRVKVERRLVTQDGTAPTALHEGSNELSRFPCLDDSQAGTAYVCHRAMQRVPEDVLVVGVGGGIDVMVALAHDARHVTGVEINGAMIDMVTDVYADYIGNLFKDERARLVHEEGRSYLRRSEELFDVIQLSGVDTYTALSTGAYTLSESYLYTVEAFQDQYRRLKEGGIVNYSRFILVGSELQPDGSRRLNRPRETIRLANIALTALLEMGIPDPHLNIVVFMGQRAASTMVKKGPFTEVELAALRAFAKTQAFNGLIYDPSLPLTGPFDGGRPAWWQIDFATEAAKRALQLDRALPAQRPIVERFTQAYSSALRQAANGDLDGSNATLDGFLGTFGLPADKRDVASARLRDLRQSFVEEVAANRRAFTIARESFTRLLKSDPAARAEFIDEYLFDLEPSRDDQPFFFNYFRLSRLDEYLGAEGAWEKEYHPDFPVGHFVIVVSLVQIAALGFVLIILPLRVLRKRAVKTPHRFRIFVYFAALGMGFMFVEIGLMQKYILFLGHPTWSLATVLSGMLLFSGLGAMLSSRIEAVDRSTFRKLMVAVVLMILIEILLANTLLEPLLGLPLFARVLMTLLFLAPLGLALGMPFPLGLRLLERTCPALIPWGWAVNGFLSVFSSLVVTMLAMTTGFSSVILIAVVVYALGFLVIPAEKAATT